jgi:hypothetical protein
MQIVPTSVSNALATDHVEAIAVGVYLANGTLRRYSNWPGGVVISGSTYHAAAGLVVLSAPQYADSSLSEVTIQIPDPDGFLAASHVSKTLINARVELYCLVAARGDLILSGGPETGLVAKLDFAGGIEEVTGVRLGFIGVRVGPAAPLHGVIVPKRFSPRCYKVATDNPSIALGHGCPYAATCAKTWAACGANGQQANFGGDTHLPPLGYLVEFLGAGTTVNDGGGTGPGTVFV